MRYPASLGHAAVGFLLCSCAGISSAQEYVLDQWNDGSRPTLFWNIRSMGPIAQEFTPTQDRIEFAEFWIWRHNEGPETRLGVTVWSGDRQTSLGTSRSTPVPSDFQGPMRVLFSPPIRLVSGRTYLLEVRSEGSSQLMGGVVSDSPYLRGSLLRREVFYGELDLWFREGTLDFTPVVDDSWGRIKARYAPGAAGSENGESTVSGSEKRAVR